MTWEPRGTLSADDERHGTTNGYSNYSCRCAPCTDAWAAACLERKHNRVPPPTNDRRHGTDHCYRAFNCRCRRCKEAHALVARIRRQRIKSESLA